MPRSSAFGARQFHGDGNNARACPSSPELEQGRHRRVYQRGWCDLAVRVPPGQRDFTSLLLLLDDDVLRCAEPLETSHPLQSIPNISRVVGSEKGWRQNRVVQADGDLQTDGRIAAHVSERSPNREELHRRDGIIVPKHIHRNLRKAHHVRAWDAHALYSLPKRVGNPDPVGHCASHMPYFAWKPPSTFRIWPVTKLASSDSSQQIAFATSSGLPRRFIGCMA